MCGPASRASGHDRLCAPVPVIRNRVCAATNPLFSYLVDLRVPVDRAAAMMSGRLLSPMEIRQGFKFGVRH